MLMAYKVLERIEETDKHRFPSQITRDYYEIVHQLAESLACLNGLKFDGHGAHQ